MGNIQPYIAIVVAFALGGFLYWWLGKTFRNLADTFRDIKDGFRNGFPPQK